MHVDKHTQVHTGIHMQTAKGKREETVQEDEKKMGRKMQFISEWSTVLSNSNVCQDFAQM